MGSIPDWAMLIGNVGFPVIVAVYLLIRFEKRIENLTKALHSLESQIRR